MGRGRPAASIDTGPLRGLYLGEGKSMAQIASLLGTNRETIRKRLHAENVSVRPRSYPGHGKRVQGR